MRILLATLGTAGDVHPFIGIGVALKQRGHNVVLATNGHFQGRVEGAGLAFAALGPAEAYRETISGVGVFASERTGMRRMFDGIIFPAMRPLYDLIRTMRGEGPLVVAASSLCFGARIAQDRDGIPTATVHLQPTLLRGAADLPALPDWLTVGMRQRLLPLVDWVADRTLGTGVNPLRRELGLPPARRILGVWLHSPQRVIALFPPWYGVPQPDWPPNVRQTGFPRYDAGGSDGLPPGLDEFLAAGAPPIVFTPGTGMAQAERFFAESIEACRGLGRRGLLLTPHREQVPESLPETVRRFDYAPFSQVLPRACAIVHHGGVGTIAQGLAAGIPQLVVPWGFDQPDGAARVRRLGVGDSIRPREYRASAAASVLKRLLDAPEVAQRCRELAARAAEGDPVADTCREIEAMRER